MPFLECYNEYCADYCQTDQDLKDGQRAYSHDLLFEGHESAIRGRPIRGALHSVCPNMESLINLPRSGV